MPLHPGPLVVDTNVIIECHRTASWRALTRRYPTETVAVCVEETQTGFQMRRPEQRIDQGELRQSLAAIHPVSDLDLARAIAREPRIGALDPGEKNLWAHALTRSDTWILCGPDVASLRIGVALGLRDRMVALEHLLDDIGHRPNPALRLNYTQAWLSDKLSTLVLSELGSRR